MFLDSERRIVLLVLLFVLPVTGGLATYTALEISENSRLSPTNSGYAPPKYVGDVVTNLQNTLVTIDCLGSEGSGFAFKLDKADMGYGYRFANKSSTSASTRIITNAHVIQNCLGDKKVNFVSADGKAQSASIEIVDSKNDLALLSTRKYLEGISGVYWKPRPGYWVVALGSPHNFAGSVTFGNIINFDNNSIFHTASLSPGSSGGPLVDNEGYLYGVNTGAKPVGQNFNISVSLNAFCDAIVICPDNSYWEE
jgi:hypothetical protein